MPAMSCHQSSGAQDRPHRFTNIAVSLKIKSLSTQEKLADIQMRKAWSCSEKQELCKSLPTAEAAALCAMELRNPR